MDAGSGADDGDLRHDGEPRVIAGLTMIYVIAVPTVIYVIAAPEPQSI